MAVVTRTIPSFTSGTHYIAQSILGTLSFLGIFLHIKIKIQNLFLPFSMTMSVVSIKNSQQE